LIEIKGVPSGPTACKLQIMISPTPIPLIPSAVGLGLRPLPLAPLALAIDLVVRSVARRHARMFERLAGHADKRFLIVPTDLPFVFVITPRADNPSAAVARSAEGLDADARIAGPIAALVGMVHGAYDGDALFFSGDLAVEGDVEAVLALRNALDDAEIDLVEEAAAALGPLASPAQQVGRVAATWIEWMTGLAMTRPRVHAP
jgi:O2-independent ubiquinone biosynthesis accessory factor UbiT